MARRKHPVAQRYCDDCNVAFQIYTTDTRPKFYCPLCGDAISVHIYVPHRTDSIKTSVHWKDEELAYLPLIQSKELAVYQVAELIGRSANCISKKYGRWLKKQKE